MKIMGDLTSGKLSIYLIRFGVGNRVMHVLGEGEEGGEVVLPFGRGTLHPRSRSFSFE